MENNIIPSQIILSQFSFCKDWQTAIDSSVNTAFEKHLKTSLPQLPRKNI